MAKGPRPHYASADLGFSWLERYVHVTLSQIQVKLIPLQSQTGSGKSSLINTVFKVNLPVCIQSCFVSLSYQPAYMPKNRLPQEDMISTTRLFQKIIVISPYTRALDLDPVMTKTRKPSRILSQSGLHRAVQPSKNCMQSGRRSMLKSPISFWLMRFNPGYVFQLLT